MENNVSIKQPNFKKNIFFNFIVQFLTYLIPLVVSPYISHIFGSNGVGTYSYANSIVSFFSIAISFGFLSYGNKVIAQLRNDRQEYSNKFWSILIVRDLSFLVVSAVFFSLLFTGFFGEETDTKIYLILSFTLLEQTLNITFLFQGLEKFKKIAIANLVMNVIFIICIFVFVRTSDDFMNYVWIKATQLIVTDLFLWIFSIGYISKPILSKINLIEPIKGALPFLIATIAPTISATIDKTMLGKMVSISEVGIYEQPLKIISLVSGLVYAISPVILSRMSLLYKEKKQEEINSKIADVFELLYLIAFPAIGGLYCLSRFFIPIYFGEDFYSSINVIYCLIPIILFSPFSSLVFSSYYYPVGKGNQVGLMFVLSVSINVITSYFLIKVLGASGAALGSLIAEFVLALLASCFSWKQINFIAIWKHSWKALTSSIIMTGIVFVCSYLTNLFGLSKLATTIIGLAIGIFTYLLLCILFKEKLIVSGLNKIFKRKKDSQSNL